MQKNPHAENKILSEKLEEFRNNCDFLIQHIRGAQKIINEQEKKLLMESQFISIVRDSSKVEYRAPRELQLGMEVLIEKLMKEKAKLESQLNFQGQNILKRFIKDLEKIKKELDEQIKQHKEELTSRAAANPSANPRKLQYELQARVNALAARRKREAEEQAAVDEMGLGGSRLRRGAVVGDSDKKTRKANDTEHANARADAHAVKAHVASSNKAQDKANNKKTTKHKIKIGRDIPPPPPPRAPRPRLKSS